MHEYGDNFYRFLAYFAVHSAEQIVALLSALLPINSIVDFGCGQGAWLSVWRKTAVPGQGGEHHINEQSLEYWREKFREHRYVAIDSVRPKVIANLQVQHWCRYNIILYAEEPYLATLPDPLRAFRVPEDQRLPIYWPLADRVHHAVIRHPSRAANPGNVG